MAMTEQEELDALNAFLKENAAELIDKPRVYETVGNTLDDTGHFNAAISVDDVPELMTGNAEEDKKRLSTLQKINAMGVGDRVKLAFLGNKEERMILIRDGSKVVSSAVLASPKISDQEIETIAAMKNVQESVLRGIASKRKFMKQYSVVRALVNNPRCPLDVQMNLAKNLMNQDLKSLSMNKNVSETVRKLATKLFKERTEKKSPFGG